MNRRNVFSLLGMVLCVVALLLPGTVLADAESVCETARTAALQAQNEALSGQSATQNLADRYTELIERWCLAYNANSEACSEFESARAAMCADYADIMYDTESGLSAGNGYLSTVAGDMYTAEAFRSLDQWVDATAEFNAAKTAAIAAKNCFTACAAVEAILDDLEGLVVLAESTGM